MLAEAAWPDQRAAKKNEVWALHPGSPEVTFLGTDTSFTQSHPTLCQSKARRIEKSHIWYSICVLG